MEKLHYTQIGHLATGGFANLERIVLPDGTQAVLRKLKPSKVFNIKDHLAFRRGTVFRQRLSGHPNIISTYERGYSMFCPYEIIEFFEGVNLKTLMNSYDPLVTRSPMDLILPCAEALAWIHQCGFMHLDFKPENVLVRRTEGKPIVKLTDFDLMRPSDKLKKRKQMGTLSYMAPEQFKRHLASPAADVFAFGITAYQLLTGKYPFPAETEREARLRQMSSAFIPVPVYICNEGISRDLSDVIMTALQKSRSKRYPSMVECLAQLRFV